MKPEVSAVTVDLAGGKQLTFETGKLAKQAHGAAVVRMGDNVVLATAVANPDPREGIDFFPLTVDYREYTYAGGRFPGGFIKREGRMSEREVLTSRQIDRPVRPMFAEGFKCETQVIAFVLSADASNDPDVLGINGASAALTLSDIPFLGPIGAVRVGQLNGQFVINPTYDEMRESPLNIMVVGTADGIVMIESGAKEVSEEIVVDAIEFGHTEIKKICAAINDLRNRAGKKKREVDAAGIRSGLLRRAEKESRRGVVRRARHQKASEGRKLHAGKGHQEEAASRNSRGRREGAGEAETVFRSAARTHLPRGSAGEETASRCARLRRSPRHLDRSWSVCHALTAAPSSPAAKPRRW